MDCVGCEKCKMWAKLQLLGIATSLKILFSAEDCGGRPGGDAGGERRTRGAPVAYFGARPCRQLRLPSRPC